MSILDQLARAHGGAFFSNAGKAAGLSSAVAEEAIGNICPIIAQDLKAQAQKDPEAFENLLDLLEDSDAEAGFDDVENTTGAEALADGRAILDDLYGSPAKATQKLSRAVSGVTGDSLSAIGAISAVCVLTSLAQSNRADLVSVDAATVASGGAASGGFFSILIAAILKGLMQGAARQLAPKRRRRRYTSTLSRRRTTTRRRKRTPSLDTIFRDILTKR